MLVVFMHHSSFVCIAVTLRITLVLLFLVTCHQWMDSYLLPLFIRFDTINELHLHSHLV